jgi:SNF2 family DNA or RNA helicase
LNHTTLQKGQIVRVRTRTYVVEDVVDNGAVVSLACLDDDAQGEPLEVVWDLELDAEIVSEDSWKTIGKQGFDNPKFFASYINTLRWNCVTATDPKLFQAPFRAGIRIDAYQLDPLAKALQLPRVNLFIADDVGLGKTIEAGLIATELLLRRRIREIVVACPPTMLEQWKDELENRFGLTFEILDRQYIEKVRRERGYGVNPWKTFPRFLISHRLLIDELYVAPMRDWLESLRPGTIFIFDEAHHAAPASGARYAIDSRITKAIRDISPRFEHRLFLSATPHNGHSNSFSALLELLDSHRFTRGVKVRKTDLDKVMVRRLKEDIRIIEGGLPERKIVQVDVDGLSESAPELMLSKLLNQYRKVRQQRMAGATKKKQAEASLLISGLQQRLLSSVEAFARTLRVHRRTMERIWAGELETREEPLEKDLLKGNIDSDDDRSQLVEEEQQELLDDAIEVATATTAGDAAKANIEEEKNLLSQLEKIAEEGRGRADAKVVKLLEWIQKNMCPGIRVPGKEGFQSEAQWNDIRLLIFTEYEDTRRYLESLLRSAIEGTHLADHRIEVFHGPTPSKERERIKRAFNATPSEHPVRILVATDAAREGLNLQAHCWNLFHFDLPWNPSRLEQRNGRIDRKLQLAPQVFCHYFYYVQRLEDKVLQALVRKTDTIHRELGSLSQVLDRSLEETLSTGIKHEEVDKLAQNITNITPDAAKRQVVEEELEETRERQDALRSQVDRLRNRINDAQQWIHFDTESLKNAVSCSLELLGAPSLNATETPEGTPQQFVFPDLETREGADPTWSVTMDILRTPPKDGKRSFQWRRENKIRPVIFNAPDGIDDDTVQLHLQHRVVQRLLGRFVSQGFVHHDLSRACLAQTKDAVPRVILIGRISVYGKGAVRLHEQILTASARWIDPSNRKGKLSTYSKDADAKAIELLDEAFAHAIGSHLSEQVTKRLHESVEQDIEELLPHLMTRGEEAKIAAEAQLNERGKIESEGMLKVLQDQKKRVETEYGKQIPSQMMLDFDESEKKQYESNRRYWKRWLETVDKDIEHEPARILDFYKTSSHRIEPLGIVYLWPVTG